MQIFKGVMHCDTCKKKVILLSGQILHVESDGTIKLIEGHGSVTGGAR